MSTRKTGLLMACSLLLFISSFSQNKGSITLDTGKFITGDDPSWSNISLMDTGWKNARLGEVWQRQGFPDYHGYAWYRIHVNIPSSLKNNAGWKDSLRIFLAHVNDVDETYLNGKKIGKTGMFPEDPGGYVSKWPAVREYHIGSGDPAIKWDQENIIAIRVYDGGGSGGIFMGKPFIDMLEKIDGISFDHASDIQYLAANRTAKSVQLSNKFSVPVNGIISYRVYDALNKKELEKKSIPVQLAALSNKQFTVQMPHAMGIELTVQFSEKESGEIRIFQQIVPYLLTPAVAAKPRINGPKVFGVKPGSPFFFKIPASGKKPITFTIKNLPKGLSFNATTGLITGTLPDAGNYTMTITASNATGKTERPFTIKAGNVLALTPPISSIQMASASGYILLPAHAPVEVFSVPGRMKKRMLLLMQAGASII